MQRVTTCGVKNAATLAALMSMALVASSAFAQEKPKPPSCQEQLNDTTVLAHNLATDRSQKEKTIANLQVAVMQLRQRNEQLEKQIAEMQKALTPKAEEKKAP